MIRKPSAYGITPKAAVIRLQKYRPLYLLKVTKTRTMSSMALYRERPMRKAMMIWRLSELPV